MKTIERYLCADCAQVLRESQVVFRRLPNTDGQEPKYQAAYLRAFTAMLKERERRGKLDGTWRMGTTAEDVYRWWMEFEKYGIEVLP